MSVQIQKQSPYEYLDPVTADWVGQMKVQWSAWGKSDALVVLLYDFFANSCNPYESALTAMVNSGDFYSTKQSSLSHFIMEKFASWKLSHNLKLPPLTLYQKQEAFNLVIRQKCRALTKIVIEIYEMKADKQHFINSIQTLVQKKMYKEACQTAGMLQLHDQFGIEEFIIPLIFQDKFSVAQEFLNDSPRHQVEIAQYLDKLIGKKCIKAEIERLIREINIFDPKIEGMSGKPLIKLLKRIMIMYNLPEETCPNLAEKRGVGILQFLLHKRFVARDIGIDSWSEMVEEVVGDDPNLQLELIIGVSTFGKEVEGIKWAEKYNVPFSMWPYKLQMWRRQQMGENSSEKIQQSENWDILDQEPEIKFHQMAESRIHLIDSVESFSNFLHLNLSDASTCGIDCEWKPSMGLKKCELAVIQVAIFESAYVIDIVTLLPKTPEHFWRTFRDKIFFNDDLLKIGFAMDSDFTVLTDTIPYFKHLKPTGHGYLDLLSLWRALVYKSNFTFPFPGEAECSNSESLSRLVELSLGKKLDKSDQFSNWEKRPLRKSQITYAALDAYCLLEVYEVLRTEAEKQGIPFCDVVASVTGEDASQKKHKKKSKPRPS